MAFRTVAYGTDLDEFKNSLTMDEVPHGTKMKLEINTSPWPIAGLADLWGAEWVADQMLDNGARIDDVRSDGNYKIIVDMTAQSVLVWVILGIISVIGISILIREIRLLVDIDGLPPSTTDIMKWVAIGSVGLVAIILLARR